MSHKTILFLITIQAQIKCIIIIMEFTPINNNLTVKFNLNEAKEMGGVLFMVVMDIDFLYFVRLSKTCDFLSY